MLKLYSVRKEDVVYTFLGGQKYAVGRKNGDVTLPDDQSISRHHADIEVDHPRANIDNPALQPTLMITDVGSKFGTYINEQIDATPGIPINMREPVNLENASRVRFGRQWSEFRFEYTPLVVTCSTLRDTIQLKELICQLGGHLVSEWTPQCRYVVMDSVTLTIKAVCALLSGACIVSPNYFKDLVASVRELKTTQLDPIDYIPPLAELGLPSSNVNFKPVPARSTLFRGKTFLFYNNRQMKKLRIIVQTGGGNVKLILDCSSSELGYSNILMMQPPVEINLLDKTTVKAIDKYKASGKRLIQESEISLAAVYISTTKHCNPKYDYAQGPFRSMPSQTQRSPNKPPVIVPETQSTAETQRSIFVDSRTTIEESCNLTAAFSEKSGPSNSSSTQIKTEKNDGKRQAQDDNSSSSKRRIHSDTVGTLASGSEPANKRLKNSSFTSQNLTKSKTLHALFQMSDSDDDDDDDQDNNNATTSSSSSNRQEEEADPESQSQRRTTNVSAVAATEFDFVGIPQRHLRSPNKNAAGPSTRVTRSSRSNASAKASLVTHGTPFVDFIPGSPDDSDEDVSILPTAALPTMALPTMPLPTAQLPTLVLPRSSRSRNATQENLESSLSTRSSKRRANETNGDDDDIKPDLKKTRLNSIVENKSSSTPSTSTAVEINKRQNKMMINGTDSEKKKTVNVSELLKPAPVIYRSLIWKDRPRFPPQIENTGVPNFKRFKKVWPLALAHLYAE